MDKKLNLFGHDAGCHMSSWWSKCCWALWIEQTDEEDHVEDGQMI